MTIPRWWMAGVFLVAGCPVSRASDAGADVPSVLDVPGSALDAPALDASPDDDAPAVDWTGVTCGETTCRAPEGCCQNFGDRCTLAADCSAPLVTCDGNEDCAVGELCCVARYGKPGPPPGVCRPAGECGCGDFFACHSGDACPDGECSLASGMVYQRLLCRLACP